MYTAGGSKTKFKKPQAGTLGGPAVLTDGSPDLAKGQGEADKGPVPLMVLPNSGYAHEDEDQGLTDTAQHLHEILDSRVGFLGHVFLYILFHCHCTGRDSAKEAESQREAYDFATPTKAALLVMPQVHFYPERTFPPTLWLQLSYRFSFFLFSLPKGFVQGE